MMAVMAVLMLLLIDVHKHECTINMQFHRLVHGRGENSKSPTAIELAQELSEVKK